MRAAGDQVGNQQRNRRDQHDDQRDGGTQREHENQRAGDGHHAGKQLGEAHEQTIRKGIDVGNHAADDIAGGMRIEILERQLLDAGERIAADIAHGGIGDAVIEFALQPLRRGGDDHAYGDDGKHGLEGGEIDFAGRDDTVNRAADKDGQIQREHDNDKREQQRNGKQRQMRTDIAHDAPEHGGAGALGQALLFSHGCSPPSRRTGMRKSPDRLGRKKAAGHACRRRRCGHPPAR